MSGRFSDRAKKVMALANQEAQRLNHEYLAPEHVLIALLREGNGTGTNVLKKLGVDLEELKNDIAEELRVGPAGMVIGERPQTSDANRVVGFAVAYAAGLGHEHVGTEHLVAGLLFEKGGIAYKVLACHDIQIERYAAELRDFSEKSSDQEVWRVPRDRMNISQFLGLYGFGSYDNGSNGRGILGRKDSEGRTIGIVPSEGKPIVFYGGNEGEIDNFKDVLELRAILDAQGVQYEEKPPREEVAERLRTRAREAVTLADRVEGK